MQRGEVERLIGVELHGLRQHAVVDGVQRVGAFRYYNNVGAFFAVNGFAQPSRRQQLIVDNQPVIVDEQNVQSRLHIPVLIGIVEDYDIGVLGGLIVDDMVDAAAPVGIDGNLNVGKFLFHLEGFVTDVAHGGVAVGEDETVSLAFVPPAQYGHLRLALEQSDEILHMGCLSRPADGDVADGNDGSRETPALQDIEFEELVSDAYAESVDAAQGPQPPVNFYVVAFHYIIMVMSLCVYCFLFYLQFVWYARLDSVHLVYLPEQHHGLVEHAELRLHALVEIIAAALRLVQEGIDERFALGIVGGVIVLDFG